MRINDITLPVFKTLSSEEVWKVIDGAFDKVNLNHHKDVLLIVDDHTRPDTGVQERVLNKIIDLVGTERVAVVVASGMHRPISYQEALNKLGSNIKRVRLYSHNPMTTPSPFLNHKYFIVGVNTVLPHLHTDFTSCGKLICPGLKSFQDIQAFHTVQAPIAQLIMTSYKTEFDIGFDVYVNSYGLVVHIDEHDIIRNNFKREYYTVDMPDIADVALLKPVIKWKDFQQAMNVLNIMKYTPLVNDGGTIAIEGCTPEGMGVHYLFQQPNGIRPVKYDEVFKQWLMHKNVMFIMPELNITAIQEYFNRAVTHFDAWDKFVSRIDYMYGKNCIVNRFHGADIMIGRG